MLAPSCAPRAAWSAPWVRSTRAAGRVRHSAQAQGRGAHFCTRLAGLLLLVRRSKARGPEPSPPEPPEPEPEPAESPEPVAWFLLSLLRLYRQAISPLLPPNCRFAPSCSRYGIEAVQRYGAGQGGVLLIWRLIRCSPLVPVDRSKVVWAYGRFCVSDEPEDWHEKLFGKGELTGALEAEGEPSEDEASRAAKRPLCDSQVASGHGPNRQVPTLVIHGSQDRLIDPAQGKQLTELCPSQRKLFVCPKMGHNDDLLSDADFLFRPMLQFFPLPDYNFTELKPVPKEVKTTRNTNHEGHVAGLASADRVSDAPCGRCAMRPDAAALLLFADCRALLFGLLPDPLDWRCLQCAARSLGLREVHLEPALRTPLRRVLRRLRRLPCDLLGREVRSAELSVEELRFFVEMLKARPREAQGDVLNLQPRFAQLDASHGRALGCWLRSFQGALGLAECRGLLGPALLQGLANTPLRLRKLDLCACGVSPEHLAALLQNARLEELNLSFNELTFEAFEGLARSDCRVSKLVLKHCDLSAQSLPLSALSCLQLAELDLRWNPRLGLTSGDLQADGDWHAELREMLRALVPEPLEWRALQLAATWAEVGRPLQEVHRRPGLRTQCRRLRVRLRGLDRRDLLAGAKRPLEDLRFAVELLGARPRSAPADRPLCRIQQLDLGRAPLPAGGRAEGTAQAAALGVFLRSCSQLSELRLEGRSNAAERTNRSERISPRLCRGRETRKGGSAHLCTPAALDAITVSLGDLRLPLRALLFGGCSVSSEAAAPLGRLLRRCPRLARLSLAGARRLGPGLGTLAEAWARGETLAVEELVFSNCGLDESSAPALGQLLRQCQRLVHLVLDGNKALFRAPSLVGLLQGLGDEGLPELRSLVAYDLAVMDEAAAEAFDRFVNRCSALRGEVAAGGL
ncbi:unnamed protein product [Effrenium voratum]|nr:unnamed protein product [Effrenium voratum]